METTIRVPCGKHCRINSLVHLHSSHLLPLHQNSEAVQGPEKLTHRDPHIQPADPCNETAKGREESANSPTNSCPCFCVMDAPEIGQSPGLAVESEFLTAIQASDVGSSAINRSASGQIG